MSKYKVISQKAIENKRVIVRCNLDVPIKEGKVSDTTRLESCLETLKMCGRYASQVVIIGHLGRPPEKFDESFSLGPLVSALSELLGMNIDLRPYVNDFRKTDLGQHKITMLENLRFYSEESSNNLDFSSWLASLADIYINECFATAHRDHASITGITKFIPSFAGFWLHNELSVLTKLLTDPDHPLVVVLGGAKLETKKPLVDVFAKSAEKILVGGKIAQELDKSREPKNVLVADLTPDGKDITSQSAKDFAKWIHGAKTVIFNGPMGMFEKKEYQLGTKIVAHAVNNTSAYTVIGGGDTEAALTILDEEANINFISTGGGAMLQYLSTRSLVGVDALQNEQTN